MRPVVDFRHPQTTISWNDQANSKEAAVAWARRCPVSDGDGIEVREVFEMAAFPVDVQTAADNSTVRADRNASRRVTPHLRRT
jgi:hypothetical protein